MKLNIRAATVQDVDSVYELVCELENIQYTKKSFVDLYKINIDDLHIGYFVAEINESVVGFGSVYINKLLHHCGDIAEIQELIVSQEFHNKNIGKILLNNLIEWGKKRGAAQIEVTCNILRVKAQKFYKANGFLNTHQKLVFMCD
ncbi:MAG: hypothetical protein C0625_13255 [Arcobacter sp.]|nr:MAG: hypothetical protein C0625_13255 [Arcobacter sp.]